MRTLKLTFCLTALTSLLGVAACDMGGCPWLDATAIDVTPGLSCLELYVPTQGDDPNAIGGCVNPVIAGRNLCEDDLEIDASPDGHWEATTVTPGASIQLLVSSNACDRRNGQCHYAVPGFLGEDALLLEFATD